eukprot:4657934-Prymnesium_polylepis.2
MAAVVVGSLARWAMKAAGRREPPPGFKKIVQAHAALKTNASRRHEWKFLADQMDLPSDSYVHTSQILKDAYIAHFGKSVPGLRESLSLDSSLDQDGKISFFELALFLSQQSCLPSFRLTAAELTAEPHKRETVEKLSNALELFATIKREFVRLAREVGMPVKTEDTKAIYEEAITFEAFYFVMAIDESEMETKEGDHGLATHLFNMVDCALLGDDEEGDGGISRDEVRSAHLARQPQPPLQDVAGRGSGHATHSTLACAPYRTASQGL